MKKFNDELKEEKEIVHSEQSNDVAGKEQEMIKIHDGLISVPKDQRFKFLNYRKGRYYSVLNEKNTNVLKNPILTEKTVQKSQDGFFVFSVEKKASKSQIVAAIERMFAIAVNKINTVINGKQTARWSRKKKKNVKIDISKKAYVKFNDGVDIDIEKIQKIMEQKKR